jgi:hypothetical protein
VRRKLRDSRRAHLKSRYAGGYYYYTGSLVNYTDYPQVQLSLSGVGSQTHPMVLKSPGGKYVFLLTNTNGEYTLVENNMPPAWDAAELEAENVYVRACSKSLK